MRSVHTAKPAKKAGKVTAAGKRARKPQGTVLRLRMAPDDRERLMVREAISFFSEFGFDGQTREFARRLKITQPLLYRYFPNKEALIDRVYEEVFLKRWNPDWDNWIKDRSCPLQVRLTRFYKDYANVILSYEWVRLFLFAGLKGVDINERSIDTVMQRIYPSVICELRLEFGCLSLKEVPMRNAERELVLALHTAIFFLGVRRWVYHAPFPGDQDQAVAAHVAAFLNGTPPVVQTIKAVGSISV